MELQLSVDQELFRATTRRFLEAMCPLTEVRRLEAEPSGFDPEWWRDGAALGWTAMLVPEEDGGGSVSGEGLLDLVIIAEEMGRLVSPGPLLPVNVVASALAGSGSPEQRAGLLRGVVAGEVVLAWAHAEPASEWFADPTTEAVATGDGYLLRGVKSPIEAAAEAQHLLVSARTAVGTTQFLVPTDADGVTITALGGIDLVKRFAEVRLDNVEVSAAAVVGDIGGAAAAIDRQRRTAAAIQCAETIGAADRVLGFTLEYVDERSAFGRPLSSYQALKHRFADMKLWLEAGHATATAMARAVQRDSTDADELVSAAQSYIGLRATDIIQDCVQMHGGIGVTWEHDLHLYLRRATLNREMYGTPGEHRERIAALIGMGGAA